jgi:hypothetical protein
MAWTRPKARGAARVTFSLRWFPPSRTPAEHARAEARGVERRAVIVEIVGGTTARSQRETRLATMEAIALMCSILV